MNAIIGKLTAVTAGILIATTASAQRDQLGPTPPAAPNARSAEPMAHPVEDAQQQARDLLTGTVAHEATMAHQWPGSGGDHPATNTDPQEQARRLILGAPKVADAAAPTVALRLVELPSANRRGSRDLQELARRMILGAHADSLR